MKKSWFSLITLILLVFLFPITAQAKPAGPDESSKPGLYPPQEIYPGIQFSGQYRASGNDISAARQNATMTATGVAAMGLAGTNLVYDGFIGNFQEPYLIDTSHIYGPNGMEIDSSGNLYITEETGQRLLRFPTTVPGPGTVIAGQAGIDMHHDQFLSSPRDVALGPDGNLWVVMNNVVKVFGPDGTYIKRYPDDAPWESGPANNRFNSPRGIAFDQNGYLFVSDTINHRIQIFNVSGTNPVHIKTIGVTEESGNDNTHFNEPAQLAFDDQNALYVVDTANSRVQKCTSANAWLNITCTTFLGGTWGGDPAQGQLGWTYAITIDWNPTGDDIIYIANSEFNTVYKCTMAGACTVFLGQTGVSSHTDLNLFTWIGSLNVDSAGNVYVADWDTFTIRKYSSAGSLIGRIAGTMNKPYETAPGYFNYPRGLTTDTAGNMYVLENRGRRLIKLNPDGSQAWGVGEPAVWGDDNNHLGSVWANPEGSPAVDKNGRIYVPDTGNQRVQIFNPNGSYYDTMEGFSCPAGVAIHPISGDILVVNRCNHNVLVYNSNRVYKTTIGVQGEPGSNNAHFRWPWDIAVDQSGAVYVADSDNYRVQKCTSLNGLTYSCMTFAGTTGEYGGDFSHFYPGALTVDAAGRVYVADFWSPRLLVYDKGGAYLASIGGWGEFSGQFYNMGGVTVGSDGTIYVADQMNAIIQKFHLGLQGWKQINPDGFGAPTQSISALGIFNGSLYAGTYDTSSSSGAQIWRKSAAGWEQVVFGGWNDASNIAIDSLYAYNGYLYAGTWNLVGDSNTNGGQLRRTSNGTTWQAITTNGFGDNGNSEIFRMFQSGSQICGATWRVNNDAGAEVWCSDTGNPGTWTERVSNGFGVSDNMAITAWAQFSGAEYAGTYNINGAQLWRKVGSGSWNQVSLPSVIDSGHIGLSDLELFNGRLYAILDRTTGTGGSLISCQTCNGTDWQVITNDGFGNAQNRVMPALEVYGGKLYAIFGNPLSGLAVLSSTDGMSFLQVVQNGFGISSNSRIYWANPVVSGNGSLFVGTINRVNGGEIWTIDHPIFLPLARR